MDTKLVIFVAISAFLIVAVYGSSVPRVFAKEICNVSVGDSLTLYCTDTVKETVYICEYKITGIKCIYPHVIDKIPAALKEALDHATQESQNNTKVPIIDRLHVGSLKQDINTNNTNADVKVPNTDILKDNATLEQNNDNNTNDNVKEPKAPKVSGLE